MPFTRAVTIHPDNIAQVVSVNFMVHTKPGNRSKDVNVTYSFDYLKRNGYVNVILETIEVPVFGLYASYLNNVDVTIYRSDNTTQTQSMQLQTAEYNSEFKLSGITINKPYDNPNVSFLLIESIPDSPIIVDIDGEVRWQTEVSGASLRPVYFENDGFLAGDTAGNSLYKINFENEVTSVFELNDPRYKGFHHNIESGKQGLLAEIGFADENVVKPESVLIEIAPQGLILNSWDFDAIVGGQIKAAGEDPSALVQGGVDWFHMNSAIYTADDSIIASSRENFVIKVDYSTQKIKWILGNPAKLWYQNYPLSLRPLALSITGNAPIGQHALSVINDPNHLLLFNNGYGNPNLPSVGDSRTYSGASLYEINESQMTATEIWSFYDNQAIFSPICGSAYKTESGEYLIEFATAALETMSRIMIVDANQNVNFDMVIPRRGSENSCATVYNVKEIKLESLSIQ
ncbi:MAG: aryl-sulfate sulfotransferase [Nitrospirota bacterium]